MSTLFLFIKTIEEVLSICNKKCTWKKIQIYIISFWKIPWYLRAVGAVHRYKTYIDGAVRIDQSPSRP